jgi:hypothetical protein
MRRAKALANPPCKDRFGPSDVSRSFPPGNSRFLGPDGRNP